MAKELGVVGIGNAIVDVLVQIDDMFLKKHKLEKGHMTLIEEDEAKNLYQTMGPAIEMSGGSAANTIAAYASLGGSSGFIGKVSNDQLGDVFKHDIQSAGVYFETQPLEDGPPTARSHILVTPDAERTMCTFLGSSVWFSPSDLNQKLIESAEIIYLEGYLFDRSRAKAAFTIASEIAHTAEKKVALTLSDSFCVQRHREEFIELVKNHIDILFCNEDEIKTLFETLDLEDAVSAIKGCCDLVIITQGSNGSLIISGDEELHVPACPVQEIIDTTGAGDLYAAGFLFGYTQKLPLLTCGKMGAIAAAEVIQHLGARVQTDLKNLVNEKLSA